MKNPLDLPINRSVTAPGGTPVYQFGCGRYLMPETMIPGDGIRLEAGREILRYGNSPLVVGGPTALLLAGAPLRDSLEAVGVRATFLEYSGFCSPTIAARFAKDYSFDLVVGVGGGRIMDFAKLIAYYAECPTVNLPTSTATCAAVSSLSVLYDESGKTIGTLCYDKGVSAVIADLGILLNQPLRLAAAGILDAMSKKIEIDHYHISDPGLLAAKVLANYTYETLTAGGKKITADTIYQTIPLTGVISGVARGRNQSNLAHALYESVRVALTAEGADALHGELVAIGLFLQLAYDGTPERIPALKDFMRGLGMPLTMPEAGIPDTAENRRRLSESMVANAQFTDTPENREKLFACMEKIW